MCNPNAQSAKGQCRCQSCHPEMNPQFWSRKRKIAFLEDHLQSLKENSSEVEKTIRELKEEKGK